MPIFINHFFCNNKLVCFTSKHYFMLFLNALAFFGYCLCDEYLVNFRSIKDKRFTFESQLSALGKTNDVTNLFILFSTGLTKPLLSTYLKMDKSLEYYFEWICFVRSLIVNSMVVNQQWEVEWTKNNKFLQPYFLKLPIGLLFSTVKNIFCKITSFDTSH